MPKQPMDIRFEGSWDSGKITIHASSQKEAEGRVREYLAAKIPVVMTTQEADPVATAGQKACASSSASSS